MIENMKTDKKEFFLLRLNSIQKGKMREEIQSEGNKNIIIK